MSPGTPIIETAPAKINLYLHVVGKRENGYHQLDSLVVFADLADSVTAMEAPARVALRGAPPSPGGPRLMLSGPFSQDLLGEPPATNLVLRAAFALAGRLGREPEAMLALDKRLPISSGIGGGSTDAAATLRALARLWGVAPDDAVLYEVAASLGADVPVCLAARPCLMSGVGERVVEAPPLPPLWLVLVNPGQAVSTPEVFRARRGEFSAPAPITETPADAEALFGMLKSRRNDLTDAAIHVCPVIDDVLTALATLPGCELARLSGSGATCFGIFTGETSARDAASQLSIRHPEWWVKPVRVLPRPENAPALPLLAFLAELDVGSASKVPTPSVPFPDTGGWGVG